MDGASIVRVRACIARQTDSLIEQTFVKFVADMTQKPVAGVEAGKVQQDAMLRLQGSVGILLSLEDSARRLVAALNKRDDVATSSAHSSHDDWN
jgi:hypothetical protein